MNFFTFLRRLLATEDRLDKRARLRPRTLLRLEALEDRVVPTTTGPVTNTFYVTSTADTLTSGSPTPGTLRAAVAAADASSSSTNIIDFQLTGASAYTIDLTQGALNLTKNMTIQGLGANTLFISGSNTSTVFTIGAGANVELDNLTIEDGKGSTKDSTVSSGLAGGGIYNQGILTIGDSTLSDNSAGYGGGIFNTSSGTVSISDSTLSDNSANIESGLGLGGGIYNAGTANISNSTLSGNSTTSGGGGIFNAGTASISNSTLSGNSATDGGGGISNNGTANISNSTLSGNSATDGGGIENASSATVSIFNSTISDNSASYGGGIYNNGTVTIGNSIVAQNNATPGADLWGAFTSQGYNLIGIEDSSASGFTNGVNGDIVGTTTPVNADLGALANNGGPTQTMALLPGSPAIGAGSNALIPIDPSTGSAYTTDQRGPGYARIAGLNVDIGAFEVQQVTPTVSVTDPSGTFTGNPFTATGTAQGVPGDPANGTFNYAYYAGNSVTAGSLLASAPTDVGTYTVVATFISGDSYYTNNVSAPVTFAITVATPTISVTDADGTYTGSTFPATGTALGVKGTAVSGSFTYAYYVGSSVSGTPSTTAPSAAGTYTVVATFTSSDANYAGGTAQTTFTISPVKVTSDVSVTRSGFFYNFALHEFVQRVTITNTSGSTLTGPLALQLTGLPSTATLANAGGTNNGDPYLDILPTGGSLAAGQSITVTLYFKDPTFKGITYGTEVM